MTTKMAIMLMVIILILGLTGGVMGNEAQLIINTKIDNYLIKLYASTSSDKSEVSNYDAKATNNYAGLETGQTISEEERESIDRRFLSFQNGEGEFSDEKLKRNDDNYIDVNVNDLGKCYIETFSGLGCLLVQGVLLGHFEFGDKNYIAIGIKNKDRNREIVLAQWLVDEFKEVYSYMRINSVYLTKTSRRYSRVDFASERELLDFLDSKLLNQVVVISFPRVKSGMIRDDYENKKIVPYYREFIIPKYETNVNFASKFELSISRSSNIPITNQDVSITNYSDLLYQVTNYQKGIPLMDNLIFRILETSQISLSFSNSGGSSKTAPVIDLAADSATIQLTATVLPSVANQSVVWKSSNSKIVTVDEAGLIKGHKKGNATITATSVDGSKVKASIKVSVVCLAKEITISGKMDTLASSKKTTLKAAVLPAATGNKKVAWTSSDESVASVSSAGVVKAGKVTESKTVTITATAQDGSGVIAQYVITVTP